MDEELFLPVLSHFENGNFWTASGGAMRCRVDADTGESPHLTAQVWEGPWRLQDSRVEETREFPLTEEGLAGLRACEWFNTAAACEIHGLAGVLDRRAGVDRLGDGAAGRSIRDALRGNRGVFPCPSWLALGGGVIQSHRLGGRDVRQRLWDGGEGAFQADG